MSEILEVHRDDRGVVTITLTRPEVRNALSAELMAALTTAVTDLAGDDTVRVLVLTGAGSAFSAGADLHWMRSMVDYSFEENVADSHGFEAMLRALAEFPAPVVARVNGHAIAGATGLVACADIAVSVATARFGLTEVSLGIVPAIVSAYVVPRIGATAAHRYLLTGELFDAARAQQLGLVHEVCEPDDLDVTVAAVVDTLLSGGAAAQRATKALLRQVVVAPDPADTEQARVETIARARTGPEAQTRIREFFTRR